MEFLTLKHVCMQKFLSFIALMLFFVGTFASRPYEPNSPWEKNLLKYRAEIDTSVYGGKFVVDGDRIGLVRTDSGYATLDVTIDSLMFYFDRIDLDYARIEGKAETSFGDSTTNYVKIFKDGNEFNHVFNEEFSVNNIGFIGLHFENHTDDTLWISDMGIYVQAGDVWNLKPEMIEVNENKYGKVYVDTSLRYVGEQICVDVRPNRGCYFAGWSNGWTDDCLHSDKIGDSLVAIFKPYKGSLIVGGAMVTNGFYESGMYWYKDSLVIRPYEWNCKKFERWSDGSSEPYRVWTKESGVSSDSLWAIYSDVGRVFDINVDSTMGMVYFIETKNYSYRNSDTTIVKSNRKVISYEDSLTIVAVPNPKYEFDSIYCDRYDYMIRSSNGKYDDMITFAEPDCDSVYRVTALFKPKDTTLYHVVVISNDEQMGTASGGGYLFRRDDIDKSAKANEGYWFSHWESKSNLSLTEVEGNDTIVAVFKPYKGCLSVKNAYVRGYDKYENGRYWYKYELVLRAEEAWCQKFEGWSDGEMKQVRYWDKEGCSGDSLYPLFSKRKSDVTVEAGDGGFVRCFEYYKRDGDEYVNDTFEVQKRDSFRIDSALYLQALAYPGYEFDRWSDGSTSQYNSIYVDCDSIEYFYLKAYFRPKDTTLYNIVVVPNDERMGFASGGGMLYKGDRIEKKYEPNKGYKFSHWKSLSNSSLNEVSGNDTIVAVFEKLRLEVRYLFATEFGDTLRWNNLDTIKIHNLSTDSVEYLTDSTPIIRRYEYGDTLLIEALPYKEHAFDGWQGWNMPYSKDKQIVLYCNFDIEGITAYFRNENNFKEGDSCYVDVVSLNDTLGGVSGGGWCLIGDTIRITADPYENAMFVSWNDGDTSVVRFVRIDSCRSFAARFADEITTSADCVKSAVYSAYINEDVLQVRSEEELVCITLFAANGTMVKRDVVYGNLYETSSERLPNGLYILQLHTENDIYTIKVLKQ